MSAIVQTFLNPIFPIFTMMLIGMVLGKRKVFTFSDAQTINRFVFYGALPPLVFSLTYGAPLGQLNFTVIGLYFLSEMTVFSLTAILVRSWLNRTISESFLLGMAACFVNHVFFILPIVTLLYGDPGVLPISAIITIDTVIVFCGMIMGLEIASHRGESLDKVAVSLLRNPVLIGVAFGLIFNIGSIDLHGGIVTFLAFAGKAAPPAALFSLGIIVSGLRISRIDHGALLVTAMKIVIHPLVLWLLFLMTGSLDGYWTKSSLLTAAGPCGAMPFVLALQYRVKADSIGAAIIYSTVTSLITLSIIA
jgi:malonate transporter and related proteins